MNRILNTHSPDWFRAVCRKRGKKLLFCMTKKVTTEALPGEREDLSKDKFQLKL